MARTGEVTEEQAEQALFQMVNPDAEAPAATEETVQEASPEQPDEAEPVSVEQEQPKEEPQQEVVEQQDDIESLKARFEEREKELKALEASAQARVDAMQNRFAQSRKILQDRYVRKASVTDKLVKILEQAKSEAGIDPADVERILTEARSTMNPASSSYVEPTPVSMANEDQAIIINDFFNEKGMTDAEAQEFGRWMQGDGGNVLTPIEQSVANRDLDGFLRIAHDRFLSGKRESDKQKQRDDAVGAVRAVQRTQREAARAASAGTAAPKKQPAGAPRELDVGKLKPSDISDLVKQSLEQYR